MSHSDAPVLWLDYVIAGLAALPQSSARDERVPLVLAGAQLTALPALRSSAHLGFMLAVLGSARPAVLVQEVEQCESIRQQRGHDDAQPSREEDVRGDNRSHGRRRDLFAHRLCSRSDCAQHVRRGRSGG